MFKRRLWAGACVPLAFCLLIAACGDENYDDDTGTPKVPAITQEMFKAVAEGLPQPNQYQVRLSWVKNNPPPTFTIRRKDSDLNEMALPVLPGANHEFVDGPVAAGKKYQYFLGTVQEGTFSVLSQVSVTIPTDLVITTCTVLQNVVTLGRLYMDTNAKILTNGGRLEINVGEIVSKGGVITSFEEADAAPRQSVGLPGGEIIIHAKKAQGNLTVLGRGQRGGEGPWGGVGGPGIPGPSGGYGQCGWHDDDSGCRLTYDQFQNVIRASRDPFVGEGLRRFLQRYYCKFQTGDGGRGYPGQPGGKGGQGSKGGDAAKVLITIDDASGIEVSAFTLPGRGGSGGPGGLGGIGGAGGPPGARDRFGLCRAAYPGVRGPQGPQGPFGDPGTDGGTAPLCMKLGSVTSGDCNHVK